MRIIKSAFIFIKNKKLITLLILQLLILHIGFFNEEYLNPLIKNTSLVIFTCNKVQHFLFPGWRTFDTSQADEGLKFQL
jgi:hypothetical protein